MKDDQFTQILRAINNVRDDLKDEMNRRWSENQKELEKLDEKVNKLDEKINKLDEKVNKLDEKVNKLDEKVDKNHKEMRTAFDAYENSIENMYQDNKSRIIVLEKRLKAANV